MAPFSQSTVVVAQGLVGFTLQIQQDLPVEAVPTGLILGIVLGIIGISAAVDRIEIDVDAQGEGLHDIRQLSISV